MSDVTRERVRDELLRMEEDCIHSGKAHFNASARWAVWNYVFGIPSVILSTAAGAAFFKDYPVVAGSMALCVAVLTSLMTFLKPGEKSADHKSSGDQYLALRNNSRVFREVELDNTPDAETVLTALKGFTTRRDELNQASPSFSDGDFKKARDGIDAGEAKHAVDKAHQA
ncbi:SLATT domain-containing protein [Mesorhizobium sp. ISC25]|uniref:SLATT domain-containing protein n=1 Tax=Mesorhizobium sp. ISC25 TaxID=3077335 RepID=UPI0035DB8402